MTATTITDCKLHGQHPSQDGECWLCAANRRVLALCEQRRQEKQTKQRELALRQLPKSDQ